MKRLLLLYLIMSFAPLYGQSQLSWPQEYQGADEYTIEEERQILDQLYELRRARTTIADLTEHIERDNEIDERERATAARALELEREATRLAGMERDVQKERAQLYESLYRAISAKPSTGCKIAKALTLGMYRCR